MPTWNNRPGKVKIPKLKDKLSTFDDTPTPLYIVKKRKRVGFESVMQPPKEGTYQFYVTDIVEVTPESEELKEALADPNLRWVGSNKEAYDILHAAGVKQGSMDLEEKHAKREASPEAQDQTQVVASGAVGGTGTSAEKSEGEGAARGKSASPAKSNNAANGGMFQERSGKDVENCMMLIPNKGKSERHFFMGRRVEPHQPDTIFYICTVDELWLKSQYHQKGMYTALMHSLRRLLPNCNVVQSGNGIFHIRTVKPTDEEFKLLTVVPGIGKITYPDKENPVAPGETIVSGAGGVPILEPHKALCLISGGIDSPVAAYRMMVRGCHVSGVHYLNSTNETAAVMSKNRQIAARLSRIQGTFTLRFVDISELQTAIVGLVKNCNRTLTYKWFMLHLSTILEADSKVIVTGDSLGQVASQTISNISALYPGAKKPILPPLMGMNKRDIISEATRIGTFDASIIEASDCCQYMMCKTNANIMIDTWTLNGELAKVLRGVQPVVLPMTVDFFVDGKLVSSKQEEFPFAEKVSLLYEVFDTDGRMGFNTKAAGFRMFSRRRGFGEKAQRDGAADEEGQESTPVSVGIGTAAGKAALAERYFGDVPAAPSLSNEPKLEQTKPNLAEQTETRSALPPPPKSSPSDMIYFDAGGATRCLPEVREAMNNAPYGNPSALHGSGRAARMAIERVRSLLAILIGKPAGDIYFTSGGTESNSLALHGCRIVREAWSHSSTKGDADINPEDSSLPLVRVVDLVHHETGSIARQEDLVRPPGAGSRLHVDACQALGKVDMQEFDLSQVDTLTVNSHKVNGPSGVSALYVRDKKLVKPLFIGGSQEKGVRPGTENVEAIVGFGAALQAIARHLADVKFELSQGRTPTFRQVEHYLVAKLKELGCEVNSRGQTSGYIVHATLPAGLKITNVDVVTVLSAKHRVEVGTGSACNSSAENLTTYETLGIDPAPSKRAIRFSYDRFVTLAEAEKAIDALKSVLAGAQKSK
jgi:cysteine sulfinate desulfinase/cysteine desulfurase-like protein/adenylyl- and sulfurtransferase ThiI